MSNYVTLVGSEGVERAGNNMNAAADAMQRAAGSFESVAERLIRSFDDAAGRMQDAAERIERAVAENTRLAEIDKLGGKV